jgi:hypothetical protein
MKMKRDFLYGGVLFVIVALAVGASCMGCGSPSASSEVNNQNEASVDVGNVDTGDVSVGSQETTVIVGGECDHGINWPLWGTVWFWSVVLMYGWISGNLHPGKPKHKKET